ncbi:hypothetical protein OsJ_02717 [Oryza sativa Japonica Group]|uniref:Uncharacterized protein n=3 Tax=Oryza TaxID=4527 RepID=A2ZVQ3_ORYSJ|nr:hypothetical protein OsJ_02717 [Oryza sativa Japonica Group]
MGRRGGARVLEELVPHGTPTKKAPLVAPPPPPPPPNNQESESDSDSDDGQKSDSSDDEALPVPNPALQANKNVPPSDDDEDDDQESDSGDARGRKASALDAKIKQLTLAQVRVSLQGRGLEKELIKLLSGLLK